MSSKIRFFQILIFLLILFSYPVYSTSIFNSNYVKLNITNTINFDLKLHPTTKISSFYVNSFFFPKAINETQYLNNFTISHKNYILKSYLNSYYLQINYVQNQLKQKNQIKTNFILQSIKNFPILKKSEEFPTNNLNQNSSYLKFTKFINTNNEIYSIANNLSKGENNTYLVAIKIANWVKENIHYNLSTLTLDPNQTSTDVLISKKGVCKEITNLYASLMRSLKIPTRIVSGISYTNDKQIINLTGNNWAGHTWDEVLINGKWIPIDITYDELGYVDPTHIILYRDSILITNSTNINSEAYNLKLGNLNSSLKVNILKNLSLKTNTLPIQIKISGPNKIGLKSYAYLKINLTNKNPFYITYNIQIIKVNSIRNLSRENYLFAFKPNQTKVIFYKYLLPQNLSSKYKYTFEFLIYTKQNNQTFFVKSKDTYPFISLKNMKDLIILKENKKLKLNISLKKLDFICKDNYNLTISCIISNSNNFPIKNISFCENKICSNLFLYINQKKHININLDKNLTIKLTNNLTNTNKIYNFNKPIKINDTIKINKSNINKTNLQKNKKNGIIIFFENIFNSILKFFN